MQIKGKYTTDSNFISVYTEDMLYTLARNSSDWGCVKVGERTATGQILDRETFEKWKSECTKEGTFELA
jgi:hypothetical protein|nr:MAG TPA: hypothetical protein [Caudoviricetes sp.]